MTSIPLGMHWRTMTRTKTVHEASRERERKSHYHEIRSKINLKRYRSQEYHSGSSSFLKLFDLNSSFETKKIETEKKRNWKYHILFHRFHFILLAENLFWYKIRISAGWCNQTQERPLFITFPSCLIEQLQWNLIHVQSIIDPHENLFSAIRKCFKFFNDTLLFRTLESASTKRFEWTSNWIALQNLMVFPHFFTYHHIMETGNNVGSDLHLFFVLSFVVFEWERTSAVNGLPEWKNN